VGRIEVPNLILKVYNGFFVIKNMTKVLSSTPKMSTRLLRFSKMKGASNTILQISQMLIYIHRIMGMSLPSQIGLISITTLQIWSTTHPALTSRIISRNVSLAVGPFWKTI
jgi:ABC-type proline/glycine betaine transport system permease subunit